jgi:glutamate dehydrogenase/leucine dehydrogenase
MANAISLSYLNGQSPYRSPSNREDGSITVFQGYRVQHHLALGPTKGGTRFTPSLTLGESAALAVWMSWKCALASLPYGGAKGGIAVDSRSLTSVELQRISRRYMFGDDSLCWTANGHHGARFGHK